jgi:hypothetical protein
MSERQRANHQSSVLSGRVAAGGHWCIVARKSRKSAHNVEVHQ